MRVRSTALAGILAGVLAIGGCTVDETAEETGGEASSDTLAAVLSDADGLGSMSGALDQAGLTQVFDGVAAYTVFAPSDQAFAALGDGGEALNSAEDGAVMAAVLRDHIVPGYLTTKDIGDAIDQQGGNSVKIRTMGEDVLTFSRDGETIRVTSADGASATLAGEDLRASNGVAIPIDGLLTSFEG